MIKAEILADSLGPNGDRIATLKVVMPRIVLAEFNTHRMFSRNSASSRAIPFKKMVEMVKENPFVPIAWQKDHKGMQGIEYWNEIEEIEYRKSIWLNARNQAISNADILNKTSGGTTKQLCNRLLEPFMWHTVIVTATEFKNFFKLRCPEYRLPNEPLAVGRFYSKKQMEEFYDDHPLSEELPNTDLEWLKINKSQAEIHIQAVAEAMWDAMNESIPKKLQAGEWHIPFGDQIGEESLVDAAIKLGKSNALVPDLRIAVAVSRCARLSYQTLGDDPKIDYEADLKLFDRLASMEHWSPFEHVARVMDDHERKSWRRGEMEIELVDDTHRGHEALDIDSTPSTAGWCRNFRGFIQYRVLIDDYK